MARRCTTNLRDDMWVPYEEMWVPCRCGHAGASLCCRDSHFPRAAPRDRAITAHGVLIIDRRSGVHFQLASVNVASVRTHRNSEVLGPADT
jgi:hypothetical protein